MKKSTKGVVCIAFHVNDNSIVEDIVTIVDIISALKDNGLVLKVIERLQVYLSCKIKSSEGEKRAWLRQPQLIKQYG